MPEDFVHEEWIAVGLIVDGLGQAHPSVVQPLPDGGFHERDHAGPVEACQLDPAGSLLSPQGSEGLHQRRGKCEFVAPIGADDQHLPGVAGRCHVTQQKQAALIGPLKIVKHDDHRLVARHGDKQSDDRTEKEGPLSIGIGQPGRRQVGDPVSQSGHETGQLGPVLFDVGDQLILAGMADKVAQGLREQLVGSGQPLLTVPEEDTGPILLGPSGHLGRQGRLALSRLT